MFTEGERFRELIFFFFFALVSPDREANYPLRGYMKPSITAKT
jgi:hypothetical protein